jgi:hypothetical protein
MCRILWSRDILLFKSLASRNAVAVDSISAVTNGAHAAFALQLRQPGPRPVYSSRLGEALALLLCHVVFSDEEFSGNRFDRLVGDSTLGTKGLILNLLSHHS